MGDTIIMTRGDDRTVDLTVTDKDNQPVNLASVYLWFTAKTQFSDTDDSAAIRKTSDNGISVTAPSTDGKAKIDFVPTDTLNLPGDRAQTFFWDLQGRDAGGKIITLDHGVFVLLADVTRAYT